MTNRERVIAAMNFQQTEKLPWQVDLTSQMEEKMLADPKGAECLKNFNNHISWGDLNSHQKPGEVAGHFVDEFGVIWNKNGADKDIGMIDNKLISSPDDLLKYEFPEIDEKHIRETCEKCSKQSGDNFRLASIGFSLFERAWTLCSMEDLLCYMITDPDFVHEFFQKITDYNLKKVEISLEYDLDGNYFGDDWGQQKGLIMGPSHWREFCKPYFKQMYDKAKNAGRYVVQHSCGDISEIYDDIIEIGLNVHQTFQPEIFPLEKFKPILDKRLAIWGGISTQADLPNKTPDEIREITRKTIDIMWKNGGYIAAPTHCVPGDVLVENLIAMVEVFESYR